MRLSTERFKQSIEDNIDEFRASDKDDPVEGTIDDDPAVARDTAKQLNVEDIETIDFEYDEVLEKAIEFLTKPAAVGKIAA